VCGARDIGLVFCLRHVVCAARDNEYGDATPFERCRKSTLSLQGVRVQQDPT
jgi:hypothetical protein